MDNKCESISFTQTLKILSQVVRAVDPNRACLFGSAVELGLNADDLDILVVSDTFENIVFSDRKGMIDFPDEQLVDLWPYTVEEFSVLYPKQNPVRQSIENNYIDLLNHE